MAMKTLFGVFKVTISVVTRILTLVAKPHDPIK